MERDEPSDEVSTIEISRHTTYWVDLLRAYEVFVDGRAIGKIRDGEVKTFTVTSGIHEIVLRIDWCRSQYLCLQCEPGATVRLTCRGQINILAAFVKAFGLTDRYIDLMVTETG